MRANGFTLLGCPLGETIFAKQVVEKKIMDIEKVVGKLHLMEDPHSEWSCLSLPKLSYTLFFL